MKIETKFNIGDKVWTITDNHILHTTIEEIKTKSNGNFVTPDYKEHCIGTEIFYKLANVQDWVQENIIGKMCSSKEELVSHLVKYAHTHYTANL